MRTIISSRNRPLLLVPVIAALAVALKLAVAETAPVSGAPKEWTESRASQLVFFAVLEGLYRDGVHNDDVDIIVPPGADGGVKFDREYFVYACPLCHPAFEAFKLYRQRGDFYGFKMPIDTLGPGLNEIVRAQLRDPDADIRRKAVEGLINRWVTQRLDLMRLTDAERKSITDEMQEGRKTGMGALKNMSLTRGSQTRTNCPICDGSFGACQLRGQ